MSSQPSAIPRILRAAFVYFAIVFAAGFVLGAVRTLLIAPRTGELAAVFIELPVILFISWHACGRALRRNPIPEDAASHAAMGGVAFAFLLLAELTLTITAFDGTPVTFVAHLTTPPGALGLAGQLVFAAMPLLRTRRA